MCLVNQPPFRRLLRSRVARALLARVGGSRMKELETVNPASRILPRTEATMFATGLGVPRFDIAGSFFAQRSMTSARVSPPFNSSVAMTCESVPIAKPVVSSTTRFGPVVGAFDGFATVFTERELVVFCVSAADFGLFTPVRRFAAFAVRVGVTSTFLRVRVAGFAVVRVAVARLGAAFVVVGFLAVERVAVVRVVLVDLAAGRETVFVLFAVLLDLVRTATIGISSARVVMETVKQVITRLHTHIA